MLPFASPVMLRRCAVRMKNWPSGMVATSSCASLLISFARLRCRSGSAVSSQVWIISSARGLVYQPNQPEAPGPFTSEDTAGFR